MKLSSRLVLAAAFALPITLPAATISGTVTDKTTNKPATGDTAVLLDLQQGMNESARTTIDGQGHYSFNVANGGGMHLVRVEHQKADYYGAVPPNTTTVNIEVYDVAPKVEGLHLYADVERMETDQQGLSVTESFFIRNESKPPKTQLSPRSFEFYLPAGAQLEGATAAGPGGMAVASSPVPQGDKGHYAFIFPIRPGETRFQLGYRLPYNGTASFKARVAIPTDNLAIMLPKSMTFQGGQTFQALTGDANEPGVQTYLASNVQPDKPVDFSVSGTGSIPREAQNGQGQAAPNQGGTGMADQGGSEPSAQTNRPGGGLGNPIDTPDPLQKYKWWIISGMGLALVVAAAFILRAKPGQQSTAAAPPPPPKAIPPALIPTPVPAGYHPPANVPSANGASPRGALLAALKEELFALETERLEGRLSESEYGELKSALEVVLRRALAREALAR
jgi:hypothetical protein